MYGSIWLASPSHWNASRSIFSTARNWAFKLSSTLDSSCCATCFGGIPTELRWARVALRVDRETRLYLLMSLLEREVVVSSKRGAAADLEIRSCLDSVAAAGRGAGAGAVATEGAIFLSSLQMTIQQRHLVQLQSVAPNYFLVLLPNMLKNFD